MTSEPRSVPVGLKRLGTTWPILAVTWVAFLFLPVSTTATRMAMLGGGLALWVSAIALLLLHRRGRLAWLLAAGGLLPIVLLCLPGRNPDVPALREAYLARLASYEGTPYVWGGEHRLGIDCSGLVRMGMVEALANRAVRRGDGASARSALLLWWHDCTAAQLGEGGRSQTRTLFAVPRLNGLRDERLRPGDLAIVGGGVHVLAYLGDGEWIEANPSAGQVTRVQTPSTQGWYDGSADIVRWRMLAHDEDD